MSSDMFMFDEPYYSNIATNIISPEEISGNFFTDPISTLSDSSIDSIFQEISDDQNTTINNNINNLNNTTTSLNGEQSLDQIAPTIFSNSPPSYQLETLSIHQQQQTQMGSLGNVLSDTYAISENVKSEDFQLGFDFTPSSYSSYFLDSNYSSSNNYDGGESMMKFMQRSLSSNSFDGKPSFWFQPKFNTIMEVQNFNHDNETSFYNGQIRRACSTGDLTVGRVCSSASQLSGATGEGNNTEESNFKVGKYSAEERKERIDRYRAKRTQRNFNKTIKYACRKTLADNRPRVRGRFARNDETGEIPKPACFNRYEDDDELWVDNLHEEDEERILGTRGGRFLTNFGATHHFQYCGY